MTEPGPVPVMVNGFDGSGLAGLPDSTRELIGRREAALGGAYRLFYDQPVEFARGGEIVLETQVREPRHFRRNFI